MFASSVFAALFAIPFLASSALAADCARSYTVKEGDICDSISAANNVSTYQLAAVNSQIDAVCDNLQPGQQLCLGLAGQDCTTTYVVQADDTCDLLTSSHSVNSTILYANNPQINADCTNLYIGEVLCVASEFGAPAPPPVVPATSIPAASVPAVPAPTPTPTPAPTVAAAESAPPASSPSPPPKANEDDSDDDDDDDDLPFCDEL